MRQVPHLAILYSWEGPQAAPLSAAHEAAFFLALSVLAQLARSSGYPRLAFLQTAVRILLGTVWPFAKRGHQRAPLKAPVNVGHHTQTGV